MKLLKLLAVTLVLACVATAAISGTLADQNADTKFLKIAQLDLERSGNGLGTIADKRELLPIEDAVPTMKTATASQEFAITENGEETKFVFSFAEEMYASENALDHIVAVRNCGNVTGYVRTWFAFEMGNLTADEFDAALLFNMNDEEWTWSTFEYGIIINGQRYAVVCAEYNVEGGLGAGELTEPSLLQILLRGGVSDEIVARLDGNYDFNYNVIAYSKAVSDKGAWSSAGKPWKANQNNTYPPQ